MMVNGSNFWDHIATTAPEDVVREAILAGSSQGKPFVPYFPVTLGAWPCPLNTVLDYGCGLGRNFTMLLDVARFVYACDRPAMLKRCYAQHAQTPVNMFAVSTDDCERLLHVDLVFMSLVLQHCHDDDDVWNALPHVVDYLCVFSRARHDDGGSTFDKIPDAWQLVVAHELQEGPTAERAPISLRIGITDDELRSARDERHFEALYRWSA